MQFRRQTLSSGLTVLAEIGDSAHSTALGCFVNVGSRDETDELAGVSHFLEHMTFKGTARRTADDVNREFDEIGADYNAYTSEEHTVYYAALLPERQAEGLDLLLDILRPSLREEDFGTEQEVIVEEIRMYEDQPPFGADDKIRDWFFGDHPLSRSVLGTEESVRGLTAERMRAFHAARYVPENIVLAAAGAVDFDALCRDAERLTGSWSGGVPPRTSYTPATQTGFQSLQREQAFQHYVMSLAPAPAATDPRRYAAKLLSTIIGDDQGSRLYWELVDSGLAEQAGLSYVGYSDAGALMTFLACDPDAVEDNLARVQALLAEATTGAVEPDELARAKSKLGSRIVIACERPRYRMFALGSGWLHEREYRTVRQELDAVEAVTLADLADVAAAFPLNQTATLAIGPREVAGASAKAS